MKNQIKFFLLTIVVSTILTLSFVNLPSPVLADDAQEASAGLQLSGKLETLGTAADFNSKPQIGLIIGQIIKALLSILGVIFMIYTIYAGFLWLTAGGNDEKITKAKAILRGSITGLIIVLGAYVITSFVVTNITNAVNYSGASQTG
ncbi:MAG: hypothetical protein WC508_04350 [Patescibacteria group bacterium]